MRQAPDVEGFDLLGGPAQVLVITAGDHHVGAEAAEGQRDLATDPGAAPGDERGGSREEPGREHVERPIDHARTLPRATICVLG
ncbi:MAG: hypothetical protein U5R31_09460 [Acidimicrobiia bacterium]|nr:hypothetical protein [Acidimicrobiia bacterium]